jgi:hypothetical protein
MLGRFAQEEKREILMIGIEKCDGCLKPVFRSEAITLKR